jgi:hypothetical protein
MRHARPFAIAPLALAAALGLPRAVAQDAGATPAVFRRFADHVVKLEVVEQGSGAKAELGSGFWVTGTGHLLTNYHVIAKLVHDPDRYHVEVIDRAGTRRRGRVLAVDVVHDLAIVEVAHRPAGYFSLAPVRIAQGQRLYSLGHPHDLGLSIVEGTYNGPLRHTLHERIHFTGSLNPGMSGGPAITAAGVVVGVNVATAGNQLSFLVPADRAVALLAAHDRSGSRPADSLLAQVGRQLRAYQDEYVRALFEGGDSTIVLGPYRLPTQPAPFFNCWADAERDDDDPYEIVFHECSTDDFVFVSRDHSSGLLSIQHRLITSSELGRLRFAALYTDQYQEGAWTPEASKDDVTPFRCARRNVRQGALTFRTVLCVRRYRKFLGLYDAVLRAAALGEPDRGLVTTLTISGVSYANARLLARRFLERITWVE